MNIWIDLKDWKLDEKQKAWSDNEIQKKKYEVQKNFWTGKFCTEEKKF